MEYLQQNLLWIGSAILAAVGLFLPQFNNIAGRKTISEATLLMNREFAPVLDVRSADEFEQGHIKGAKHLPLGEVEQRIGEIEKWRKKNAILVVCAGGNRAQQACARLRKKGFVNTYVIEGGMNAWVKESMPVVKLG